MFRIVALIAIRFFSLEIPPSQLALRLAIATVQTGAFATGSIVPDRKRSDKPSGDMVTTRWVDAQNVSLLGAVASIFTA